MTDNKLKAKRRKVAAGTAGRKAQRFQRAAVSLHDHLFRDIYSRTRYCLDIFRLIFTPPQFALFDWKTLKSEMNTFIDRELRERRTDLLFSVCLAGSAQRIGLLFLLEHKSRHDLEIHRQFLGYQTDIYMHWNFPVLPILVYQGEAMEWRLPLDFQGFLQGFDGELKRLFGENVLNFRYKLLNLRKLDIKKQARGLTSRPILFILQNIWNLDEKVVKELFSLSQKASLKDRKLFMDRATDYIRQYDPKFSWKLLREIEKTVTTKEEYIMPLQSSLDSAREEGLRQGIKQGMQQGMQQRDKEVIGNMLKQRLDISFISKVTGLSKAEIVKLTKNGDSE